MSSVSLGSLINYRGMNWGQFKDLHRRLRLAGSAVTSSSLTQEVASSNNSLYYKYFCHWIHWKHLRRTQMWEVPSMISFSKFKFPLVTNRHLNLHWGVKILHRIVLLDLTVQSVPWFEPNPCRRIWTHSPSQTADLSLFKPRLGVLNGVDMGHILHTWQISRGWLMIDQL